MTTLPSTADVTQADDFVEIQNPEDDCKIISEKPSDKGYTIIRKLMPKKGMIERCLRTEEELRMEAERRQMYMPQYPSIDSDFN